MIEKLKTLKNFIGNTPLKPLKHDNANIFAKLEYHNMSGSIKDRPALHIIESAIRDKIIVKNTSVIESSSGNFALALASICRMLDLNFIPVIDPNINADYEKVLRLLCKDVVKVNSPDHTGGYLLTRIKTVKKYCENSADFYWTDQYSNVNNNLSYYHGLGQELCDSFSKLDYVFIGVSSGGTIVGVSKRIKEKFPNVKVIAVDVEGSIIFGTPPQKRHISGIGASQVPPLLHEASIDDVMIVSESEIVEGCIDLLKEQTLFAGASTGAVYYAIKKYFSGYNFHKPNVAFMCCDKGSAYLDTVYNAQWRRTVIQDSSVLV